MLSLHSPAKLEVVFHHHHLCSHWSLRAQPEDILRGSEWFNPLPKTLCGSVSGKVEAQLGQIELVLVTSGSKENCQVLGCRVLASGCNVKSSPETASCVSSVSCGLVGGSLGCAWSVPWVMNCLRSCSIVLEIRVEHGSSGRYSFWTRDWNQGLWSNPVLRASELLRCYNLCLQHKETSLWKLISELCRACVWTLPPAHSSIPNLYQFTYL